jgi:hypothetical protein
MAGELQQLRARGEVETAHGCRPSRPCVVTYDGRMASAATALGWRVMPSAILLGPFWSARECGDLLVCRPETLGTAVSTPEIERRR